MRKQFSCSLQGRNWWLPILSCMVIFLFALIPLELSLMNLKSPHKNPLVHLTITGCILSGFIFILVVRFVVVKLVRIFIPFVSFGGKPFSFTNTCRRHMFHFNGQVEFNGELLRFSKQGFMLIKYIIFALILPVSIWAISFSAIISKLNALNSAVKPNQNLQSFFSILCVAVFLFIFIIVVPFFCLVIRWFISIQTQNIQVCFTGSMSRACLYVAGQTVLSILTFGIYWPIQTINIWRYFACKTTWQKKTEASEERGNFGFEGKSGQGFLILWEQTILSAITLGLYFPWAFPRCAAYFIDNTYA